MSTKKTPDIAAAERFLADRGRVVDRRTFERLFQGGAARPVKDAVAAYQNADGGFGHALEPDCRASASQPAAVEMALRLLDMADAWDDGVAMAACDWLGAVAPAEGGAAFVEATVSEGPHAPWWVPEEGHPTSLIQTGQLAGALHARGVRHPWLDGATAVMWDMIERLSEPGAYPMLGVCRFLDHVPDRARAEAAFEKAGPLLLERGLVALDPEAAGEVHTPLEFAPLPGSIGRHLFDEQTITAHLDHLAASQREDGGWMFSWPSWSPAAEADWRGFLTVDALLVLRANGRLRR
ncbi:MAG: hypothetical protein JWM19_6083 [Actinomycetia bacterium]|nr:hypothetical protein [Actinomycetes bacterium]